jgi:predicted amidophosphoribosyltransferase
MSTFVLGPGRPMARGERRAYRKEHRLCLECGVPLTKVDAKRQLCAKHAKASRKYSDAWRAKNPAKVAVYKAITMARQKIDRSRRNRRRRAYYLAHKLSDEKLCVRCSRKAHPDSNFCRKHLESSRRSAREYRRRLRKKRSAIPSSP